MMIIHQARAELAQKTLRSVNEIVGLVGAVGGTVCCEGNSSTNRMRLKRLQWSSTSDILFTHQKVQRRRQIVSVYIR